MRKKPSELTALFACVALAFTSPVVATTYQSTRGDWDIFHADDNCGMTMEFEGPGATRLTLTKFAEGTLGTLVSNANWSAEKEAEYGVNNVLNGKMFGGALDVASNCRQRIADGDLCAAAERPTDPPFRPRRAIYR